MPNSQWRNVILVVLLSLPLAGCTGQAGAASPRNVEKQKSTPDAAPLTVASESNAVASAAVTEFKPPFPNRQELFLPPEKHEAKPEQPATKRPAIQVKGFANADGMLALLVIDGKMTALRVGESRDKIEVLSIKPPKVMLRHEGQSWFESLSAGGATESAPTKATPIEPALQSRTAPTR